MADYYRDLIKILRANGFVLKRQAKGDHEPWWNPNTRNHTLVDAGTKSRSTANFALKKAGLPKAF